MATRLFDEHRDLEIAIGCSRPHSALAGLPICASESALALRTAAAMGGRSFLQFDTLGILRLLYANDPQQESLVFIKEVLKDLIKVQSVQKPGQPESYTVQPGDTIWAITHRFGMSADEFKKLNPAVNSSSLRVGTTVKIIRKK